MRERRDELVAAGVELYELRSDSTLEKRTLSLSGSSAGSTLRGEGPWCSTAGACPSAASISIRASGDIDAEAGLYIEELRSWPPR